MQIQHIWLGTEKNKNALAVHYDIIINQHVKLYSKNYDATCSLVVIIDNDTKQNHA